MTATLAGPAVTMCPPRPWRPSWAVLGYGPNAVGLFEVDGRLEQPEPCAGSVWFWNPEQERLTSDPCQLVAGHGGRCDR